MSLARAYSVALLGIDGHVVEIEADVGGGLPGFHLVGLPDAALHESKDRVRAAVVNSEQDWPNERITLTLSPATLRRAGSVFDLALACAILAAAGNLGQDALNRTVLLGELALDGRLRRVRGVLPCVLAARTAGVRRAVVPAAVLEEAALVDEIEVHGAESLGEVLAFLRGEHELRRPGPPANGVGERAGPQPPDLADVIGQDDAKRALEIAAAGGHHVLLVGPSGSGKTALAQRFAGLLPQLTPDDALVLAAIRSVAGRPPADGTLSTQPPFVAPHHSSSMAALVGGGSGMVRPGAVSLAHRGVLFMDDAPEWGAGMLDALRTPLEEGEVRLARAEGTVRYPARFQLVLAASLCPCRPAHDRDCICSSLVRRRYIGRMSGPLLDRVDLRARTHPVTPRAAAHSVARAESTAAVRERVQRARAAAAQRWAGQCWHTNSDVAGSELQSRRFGLPPGVVRPLDTALRAGQLTVRGANQTLRLSWTLADLAGLDRPDADTVAAALDLRRANPAAASTANRE